jgi:hypothetical protein
MIKLVDVRYDEIILDDDRYKAILFDFGGKEVWLPRSQIEVDTDHKEVTLPERLAVEKEIV